MAIDDRKQRVLRAIVSLYGAEGEPVGSGLLAQYFDRAVSSATLRNEMAELTRLGLLEQPHTSAGRVPSTKGYRYYLDNLMEPRATLPEAQRKEIDALFANLDYEPQRLAEGAARALAQRTQLTVFATTPHAADANIAHFEVLQVGRTSAAVLAVTNAGGVHTRVARTPQPLNAEDIALATAALNRHFTLRAAADVDDMAMAQAALECGENARTLLPVLKAAGTLLAEAGSSSMFLEGQQNLLRYAELYGSLGTLMQLFSDEETLGEYLGRLHERTAVVLGDDLPHYTMPGMCIVAKQYLAGGGTRGTLALIGPRRMSYANVIPQLEYFAALLGQAMNS